MFQFAILQAKADRWFVTGIAVPKSARDRLAALARAQAPALPLRIDTAEIEDDAAADGDPAPVVRLLPLGDGLRIPAVAGLAVRDLLEGAASLKSDVRWKEFTRRLDEAQGWQPGLPAGFEAELREYQSEGFAWMSRLARWGAGALLADDMGLGKTVQAIAVMMAKAAEGPALVVAPTSVCGNWEAELARFAPSLRAVRLAESGDRGEALKSLGPGDVLIASYGLLAREEEKLAAIAWASSSTATAQAMAVLDEAQAIKNADTQRAKASQRLKAGGVGLNLTAADYVVHLDPWWNPAVEDQASDRAHRIGQQRPVTIYRLIVKDSIEEGIVALHRQKRDIADALLNGADASGRLSEEDLLRLIRGGA